MVAAAQSLCGIEGKAYVRLGSVCLSLDSVHDRVVNVTNHMHRQGSMGCTNNALAFFARNVKKCLEDSVQSAGGGGGGHQLGRISPSILTAVMSSAARNLISSPP